MGFSLKKVGNLAGKAVGAAVGAYFGGPAGAAAGYQGSNAVLGAVGLGDDQLAAQEQWKWQKKASDYAYNQNLQMWNLANAYNDPSAQMARLQAAGLNPNLVYGGGNVTGNTSGNTPTYERPNVGYTDRSIQREQLQLALAEHQQRITNQAIENDLARQRLVLAEREADRSDRLADAQIQAYKVGLGLTGARIDEINNDVEQSKGKPRSWIGNIVYDVTHNPIVERIVDFHKNTLAPYRWHKTGEYKNGRTKFETYGRRTTGDF